MIRSPSDPSRAVNLDDRAVLCRTSALCRLVEQRILLAAGGLAYRMVGGPRLQDQKDVKDVLAYLKIAVNPSDHVSFLRILNVPRRGLGLKAQSVVRAALQSANSCSAPPTSVLASASVSVLRIAQLLATGPAIDDHQPSVSSSHRVRRSALSKKQLQCVTQLVTLLAECHALVAKGAGRNASFDRVTTLGLAAYRVIGSVMFRILHRA